MQRRMLSMAAATGLGVAECERGAKIGNPFGIREQFARMLARALKVLCRQNPLAGQLIMMRNEIRCLVSRRASAGVLCQRLCHAPVYKAATGEACFIVHHSAQLFMREIILRLPIDSGGSLADEPSRLQMIERLDSFFLTATARFAQGIEIK